MLSEYREISMIVLTVASIEGVLWKKYYQKFRKIH